MHRNLVCWFDPVCPSGSVSTCLPCPALGRGGSGSKQAGQRRGAGVFGPVPQPFLPYLSSGTALRGGGRPPSQAPAPRDRSANDTLVTSLPLLLALPSTCGGPSIEVSLGLLEVESG